METSFAITGRELAPLLSQISDETVNRAELIAQGDLVSLYGTSARIALGHEREIMKLSLLLALCEVAPNEGFLAECRTILTRFDPRFIPGEEVAWSIARLAISKTDGAIIPVGEQPAWIGLKLAYLRRFGFHQPRI